MHKIDGSQGEGGGQILRTSLSLSACTGKSVQIYNIRQGRKKPGLLRQHLACVNAIAQICGAEVTGAQLGSTEVHFAPSRIEAGNYTFSIASAGSSCLLFQTVLAPLLLTGKTSTLVFEGGTHNPLAPCYDFIRDVFLPLLGRMGLGYEMHIEQYGFFPVGGGRWSITITPPHQYQSLEIEKQGQLLAFSARCIGAGIPKHIVMREKQKLQKLTGWNESQISSETVQAMGSGNVVLIKADYEYCSELVDSIGKLGVPAESIAIQAFRKMRNYQRSLAPVGQYLADQLLLPLAVTAGGRFKTSALSLHTKTNIEVINQFINSNISYVANQPGRRCTMSIAGQTDPV